MLSSKFGAAMRPGISIVADHYASVLRNCVGEAINPTTGELWSSGVDTNLGINTYVSLSGADDLTSFRTKGRPCEWEGPWDRLSLNSPPRLT